MFAGFDFVCVILGAFVMHHTILHLANADARPLRSLAHRCPGCAGMWAPRPTTRPSTSA